MSSDREARALGAGCKIDVDGKTYTLRPVTTKHLCDLELEALSHYKTQYLKTFADNAKLLPDGGSELLVQKMEEAARWDLNDLPQKYAYDVARIPITSKVKSWIEESVGEVPDSENAIRAVLSSSLDAEQLSPKHLEKISGKRPIRAKVRWDQWWVTATMTGMVSFIASSIKHDHPEITREDVALWSFAKLAEAARLVEERTTVDPKAG